MKTRWPGMWAAVLASGILAAGAWAEGATTQARDEQAEKGKSKNEEIINVGIRELDAGLRLVRASERHEAFDKAAPNQQLMEVFFGLDAKLVWPNMLRELWNEREDTKYMGDLWRKRGRLRAIELTDLREQARQALQMKGGHHPYERVLSLIPGDVPVYRAKVTYEKVVEETEAYVVLYGRVRLVKDLASIPYRIDAEKEKLAEQQKEREKANASATKKP